MLLDTIEKFISPLTADVHWGYDLPMYISGTKHSHVDNVYHLMKEYHSDTGEIFDVIELLSAGQRTRYGNGYSKTDFSQLESAFSEYRNSKKSKTTGFR